ncbi:ProQ/FINO family protein [Kingella negevensis]|uniref:ProQ/FINO family protein n=1 Tax=Kingella negevensis TaxID=1522312 RepID=UPI00254A8E6C|nr:ProQ/FINO family protein [Kingella negevensis]MDK4679942.1 ProQ/FINO family protein [Kingella negevensis]MDK4682339.1 ProQ/FINO family protein [Kingella negevensis]MDK4690536.1 ProQ/FINO family protein [Kingella negevensis]MDK4692116.1 ProQ/FINO family protein [Kingella negevensis]MDK4698420.1 ProQ/FINO family protein [Kingella negevensis]
MTQETALGAALKNAVQTMSKKKQTEMIADYIYSKYEVFSRFKPLSIGIEKDLVEALPQFDPALINRVLSNHCRRPKYIKAVARGGKRFNLNNRFHGEVSPEEQQHALSHEGIKEAIEKQDARRAEAAQARAAKQQAKAAKKQAAE